MKLVKVLVAAVAVAMILVTGASAQWSTDPADNLLIGGGPGEQVVPHAAAVPAGGSFAGFTYTGWYNNASGNYDVALQLLSPEGVPVFADGGIIVSDQPQNSWVMDWGLATDADGNALVAFADARDGSTINVYKIGPDGSFLWGPDGVTLSSGPDFKGPPTVTATSDGQVVVAWMQDSGSAALRMQRLTTDGTPLLAAGGVVVSEASDASPAGNVLLPTGGGDVLLGYVPTYSFMGNRQIKVQRFDATASPIWSSYVMVMDDSTVPMGHYFRMTADGGGGALFCWDVTVGLSFGSRVQRVTADGVEILPHNGVYADAGGTTGTIESSAVYDPITDEITMAYVFMNSSQSQRGVRVQRLDASGARLWGSVGSLVLPQDTDMEYGPSLAIVQGAVIGMVHTNVASVWGQDDVRAFRLEDDGGLAWGGTVMVSSTLSNKQDLIAVGNGETLVGVWVDEREGTPDVFTQNVNTDGSLGPVVVAIEGDNDASVSELPTAFAAHPNYPNPFNPLTTISFDLPRASQVTLQVFDAAGRMVRELASGHLDADHHQVTWDGTDQTGRRQPSGVYHYRLVTDDRVATRAMMLVK